MSQGLLTKKGTRIETKKKQCTCVLGIIFANRRENAKICCALLRKLDLSNIFKRWSFHSLFIKLKMIKKSNILFHALTLVSEIHHRNTKYVSNHFSRSKTSTRYYIATDFLNPTFWNHFLLSSITCDIKPFMPIYKTNLKVSSFCPKKLTM